jgi:hypothetical protein
MIELYLPHIKAQIDRQRLPDEMTLKEAAYHFNTNDQRIRWWIQMGYLSRRILKQIGSAPKISMVKCADVKAIIDRMATNTASVANLKWRSRNVDNPYKIDNRRPAYAKDVERTVRLLTMQRTQYCVMSDTDPAAERAERQRRAALALTPVDRYRREWRAMQRRAS